MTPAPLTPGERLLKAGLSKTRQRMALLSLLFDGGDRHITAEQLHAEALTGGHKLSVATIYNTLRQFKDAGLLREVVVDPTRSYFDTNVSTHHHFFSEATGMLRDIPGDDIIVGNLPAPPEGTTIDSVEVIIRIKP
ncbi:MAG TPA: Fur family transcriptional regulator [Stellaceae bacterium]|nr:Fur family transcriptional regulator [Stellaceae bacterium]